MTGQKPLVSVVTASVNEMPSLGECLEHVVRQKDENPHEVFVVDRCGELTGPSDSLARME